MSSKYSALYRGASPARAERASRVLPRGKSRGIKPHIGSSARKCKSKAFAFLSPYVANKDSPLLNDELKDGAVTLQKLIRHANRIHALH